MDRLGDGATTPRDVFLGEVKRRDVFPLLILHLVRERPEYGNSIIKGVKEMTGGVMSVSPNAIYPLLRRLEEKGYVVGEWEKPDTRSRRFYTITPRGEEKYTEIKGRFEGHLLRVKGALETIHEELYGGKTGEGKGRQVDTSHKPGRRTWGGHDGRGDSGALRERRPGGGPP